MTAPGRHTARRGVAYVVAAYVVVSAVWIAVSDRAVSRFVRDPADAEAVGTLKGWAFVAVTATLLFGALRRVTDHAVDGEAAARHDEVERERLRGQLEHDRLVAQQRWLLALEAAGHGVWDYDAVAGRTYFSPRWKSMLGYRDDEITDAPTEWERLVHPDDLPACQAALQRLFDGETDAYRSEHRMIDAAGGVVWVLDQGNVIERDADGRPLRLLGTHTDVTWRVEARRELEQHRHHLEELVVERTRQLEEANEVLASHGREVADLYDHAPCGYHSVDADGTVVAMNATELQWLGYTHDQVVGRMHITDLITTASRAAFATHFGLLLAGGDLREVRVTFVRCDGTLLPAVVSATALRSPDGRFLRSRSTVIDDSERQERERRIETLNSELAQRADEAESASRAKSMFLATMSHELRTPLNAIVGLAHLAGVRPPGPVLDDHLRKIAAASGHLAHVLDDVLDLSRIEAGRLTPESVPLDVRALLTEAASLVAADASAKGLALTVAVDDDVPAGLAGDPTRLRQLALNYLANAVKFTDAGSVVARCSLEPALPGDGSHVVRVRVAVTDTGPGITEEDQRLLFRSFEQLDPRRARGRGGSGLGLDISRRLAALLGGAVGVTSEVGAGSTFWFTVRLERSAPGPVDPRAPVPTGALAGHVLLADDDDLGREVTEAILRTMGLSVEAVADGVAAVEAARSGLHDVALMDVHMPTMDGLEATRLIRAQRDGEGLPVIAMTADAFSEDRAACLQAGAVDHLAKPVTPEVLRRALAPWLAPVAAGLRLRTGLHAASGDRAVYERWLAVFADAHGPTAVALADDGCAPDELRRLVHRLKGGAGLVGAFAVDEQARRLDALLRADDPGQTAEAAAARVDLTAALVRVLDHLAVRRTAAGPGPAAPAGSAGVDGPVGDAGGGRRVDELIALLAQHDAHARTMVRDDPVLRAALGRHLDEVERAIVRFDYAAASALLRGLVSAGPGA